MTDATKERKAHGVLAMAELAPYQEKDGEEYMNEEQRAHFKRILEAWRAQLREEVDRTVGHLKEEASNYADPVDRFVQPKKKSSQLNYELVIVNASSSKKIEKTLELIERNDFGYCESCGIEIGIRRLEARPTADLCIDCKSLAEIREKQMKGH